jgi:hypothetical protein
MENERFMDIGAEESLGATAPSLTTPVNLSTAYNNTDIVWSSTVTDSGADATNVTFYISVAGSLVSTQTFTSQATGTQVNATLTSSNFTTWQNVSVIVGATDGGLDATNVTGWLNVTNRLPISLSYISPSSGTEGLNISFACYATDADGHTINTTWIVDKNSTQVANGSTGFVANATNSTVHSLTAEVNYEYTLACTPNDGYESGSQVNVTSSIFTPLTSSASLCANITTLKHDANISLGTTNTSSLTYVETGIIPTNNSVCGYTYLLNNTDGLGVTFTAQTNSTGGEFIYLINGTPFNTTSNWTWVSSASEFVYVNVTANVDISLLNQTSSANPTLTWSVS